MKYIIITLVTVYIFFMGAAFYFTVTFLPTWAIIITFLVLAIFAGIVSEIIRR